MTQFSATPRMMSVYFVTTKGGQKQFQLLLSIENLTSGQS